MRATTAAPLDRIGVGIDTARYGHRVSFLRPDRQPAAKPLTVLENHAGYQFRRRGLPLGSGAIGSAIRRVVNLRLKGNGLLWLEENAEAVLVMRAAVLTERWPETLEHVRATMASDRRLEWHWQSPDMPAELKAGVPIAPPGSQPKAKKGSESDAA